MDDKKMQELLDDPDHGTWATKRGYRGFTPNPSFFDKVEPMELVKYFADKKELLNMP